MNKNGYVLSDLSSNVKEDITFVLTSENVENAGIKNVIKKINNNNCGIASLLMVTIEFPNK